MATLEEQETTITYLPKDKSIRVYTAYPSHIRKIQADSRFTVEREYFDEDGTLEAIAATTQRRSHLNILTIAQNAPREMTAEQKAELAERGRRLAASRVQNLESVSI